MALNARGTYQCERDRRLMILEASCFSTKEDATRSQKANRGQKITVRFWLGKSVLPVGESLVRAPRKRATEVNSTHESQLERLREGHEEEWRRLDGKINAIANRFRRDLPDNDLADVVQEAKGSVWKSFRKFYRRGPGSFRVWVRTIIQNQVRTHLRWQKRHPELVGRGGSSFLERLAQEEAHAEPNSETPLEPAEKVTVEKLLLHQLPKAYGPHIWRDALMQAVTGEQGDWEEFLRSHLEQLLQACWAQAEIEYGKDIRFRLSERKTENQALFLLQTYTVLIDKDMNLLFGMKPGTVHVTVGRIRDSLRKEEKN